MKKVFVCSPSLGNFGANLAMADSIYQMAVNQGHDPVIGTTVSSEHFLDGRLHLCDEVWLYYDGQSFGQDMLYDLHQAAEAGKPIRLVRLEPTPEARTVADTCFAADSYADAPDRESEVPAVPGHQLSIELSPEPLCVNGLLLALKELEELMDSPMLPSGWWADALASQDDYLGTLGLRPLLRILDDLIEQKVLPSWPDYWLRELYARLDTWDWTAELPDLDRENLDLVGDNDWHKLGYILLARGEYTRAFTFLEKALLENPENYLAWAALGQCVFREGFFDLAVTAFEVTLKLAPAHFYAWVDLGRSLAAAGKPSEAITAFDKALDCKKDRFDPYVNGLRIEVVKAYSRSLN